MLHPVNKKGRGAQPLSLNNSVVSISSCRFDFNFCNEYLPQVSWIHAPVALQNRSVLEMYGFPIFTLD